MSLAPHPIVDDATPELRTLTGPPGPSLWNLQGMARGWRDYPEGMDFLAVGSPNRPWKAFQTAVYLELLSKHGVLDGSQDLHILDAACGIGRLMLPLLDLGHRVLGIDACRPSLEAAWKHIETASNSSTDLSARAQLRWADVRSVQLPTDVFDRVLALELLCYVADPTKVLARLVSSLRPGELFICSVEAWPGASKSWPEVPPSVELCAAQSERQFGIKGDLWVHPFEEEEFRQLLRGAGLDIIVLEPVHFFADGPRGDEVDLDRLGNAVYDEQLMCRERELRADPAMRDCSRAWLAIARKKDC